MCDPVSLVAVAVSGYLVSSRNKQLNQKQKMAERVKEKAVADAAEARRDADLDVRKERSADYKDRRRANRVASATPLATGNFSARSFFAPA